MKSQERKIEISLSPMPDRVFAKVSAGVAAGVAAGLSAIAATEKFGPVPPERKPRAGSRKPGRPAKVAGRKPERKPGRKPERKPERKPGRKPGARAAGRKSLTKRGPAR